MNNLTILMLFISMNIISSNNLFLRNWTIKKHLFGKKIKNYKKNIRLFFKNYNEFPHHLVVFD
jgi:hypothetical protein